MLPILQVLHFSLALLLVGTFPLVASDPIPDYREHQDLTYFLDASGHRQPVRSAPDWEIRKKHLLAHMQSVMGKVPSPASPIPLGVDVVEEARVGRLTRRKLTYHTDSTARRVSAYLFVPEVGGAKVPGVLCLHQTIRIGKREPAGLGANENLQYALHLAKRGYVTLAPDYPSFGEYDFDFDPRYGYQSGTMKAIYDNMRAVDLLVSLEEVDAKRIGCIGHSLGGHNTMFTAAFEPRIKVMVSNCGFTRFHKYYGGKLAGWTSKRYMPLIATRHHNNPDEVPFDFTEIVGSFAPRPFLASAPLHDSNFEVSGVRDVIAAARPVYALYGKPENLVANYPDCEHDFPPEARNVAYTFFDRHLQHKPTRP
jgi:dienelactone hydrolase